jgi:predicted nucleotide-binding protein (sugar kinase/HSP70/actin superfamily)
LRFRPYAVDRNQVEELKAQRLSVLEKVVENGAEIEELETWGAETVARFREIKLREDKRFPLVLYIGEIYMRQHDPYTNFVVHKLEQQGLEIVRDPVIDWLDYVNKMNIRNNKRDIGLALKNFNLSQMLKVTKKFAKSYLKGRYMSSVEDKIAEPFHEVLKGRHVLPKPIDMIETLEHNHEGHGNIEGESPLSTGIAYHLMNDLIRPVGDACISGIYHVGPFTCMQEGVATAKIEAMAKELRKKKPDLVFPIIHAFFGDSPSANLESEIAVFTEQCYQKREMLMEKHGRNTPSPRTTERMDIKAVPATRRTTESLSRAEES